MEYLAFWYFFKMFLQTIYLYIDVSKYLRIVFMWIITPSKYTTRNVKDIYIISIWQGHTYILYNNMLAYTYYVASMWI